MIKALIFDCFGVLATEWWIPLRDEMLAADPEKMREAYDATKATNLGFLSRDEFITTVAHLTGLPEADIHARAQGNVPNEALFRYIEAHKHYKIGLLSNIQKDHLPKLFSPEQLGLFDQLVLSFEIGAVKPDPRAYEIAAQRLETPLKQCLFVDDQPRYVAAAEALGMKGIIYQNFAQFEAEAQKLLQ